MIAILLIAHGSRHSAANTDTVALAAEMGKHFPIAVAAYLELATPSIDDGAAECIARDARQVILLPHFLSAGIHVRRDLNAARDRLTARYPGVAFVLAEPLGTHPLLATILEQRAREALASVAAVPGSESQRS